MQDILAIYQKSFSDEMRRLDDYLALLDDQETARMRRFKFEHLQQHYAISRGLLKEKLALQCECHPSDLKIVYGEKKKPFLKNATVHFNLSHSNDRWLLALATKPVGVDIEFIDPKLDFMPLAERFFAKKEVNTLKVTAPEKQREQFFALWVAKEAVVKAIGTGLATNLDETIVACIEDDYRLLKTPDDQTIRLEKLDCVSGYRAAIAMIK